MVWYEPQNPKSCDQCTQYNGSKKCRRVQTSFRCNNLGPLPNQPIREDSVMYLRKPKAKKSIRWTKSESHISSVSNCKYLRRHRSQEKIALTVAHRSLLCLRDDITTIATPSGMTHDDWLGHTPPGTVPLKRCKRRPPRPKSAIPTTSTITPIQHFPTNQYNGIPRQHMDMGSFYPTTHQQFNMEPFRPGSPQLYGNFIPNAQQFSNETHFPTYHQPFGMEAPFQAYNQQFGLGAHLSNQPQQFGWEGHMPFGIETHMPSQPLQFQAEAPIPTQPFPTQLHPFGLDAPLPTQPPPFTKAAVPNQSPQFRRETASPNQPQQCRREKAHPNLPHQFRRETPQLNQPQQCHRQAHMPNQADHGRMNSPPRHCRRERRSPNRQQQYRMKSGIPSPVQQFEFGPSIPPTTPTPPEDPFPFHANHYNFYNSNTGSYNNVPYPSNMYYGYPTYFGNNLQSFYPSVSSPGNDWNYNYQNYYPTQNYQ